MAEMSSGCSLVVNRGMASQGGAELGTLSGFGAYAGVAILTTPVNHELGLP